MYKRFLCILCTVLAFTGSASMALAQGYPGPPAIEVVGRARIMAKPTVAALSFSVEVTRAKAQDAVNENAARTQRLLDALKKILTKSDRLRTSAYALSPVYKKGDRTRPAGYRARNTTTVETGDLDKLGRLIDEAAAAGATGLGGLTFRCDNEEELKTEAAARAVKQAIKTAGALAKAAGLTIQRILNISYGGSPRERSVYGNALAAARTQTPVQIGEIPIEATVTVVFKVE
ncbi:MAG: SIMPL domain-containing protein [Deltaproteobacteria bacterium]|nr:SIMPL domain-containing protein [Deltaproteobacteria bacterium]